MKKRVTIQTPNGEGLIEDIFISELGHLMIRVYFSTNKRWISYNLGYHNPMDNFFTNIIIEKSTFGEEGAGDDGAR